MEGRLDWKSGGIALGLVFLIAVAIVKPIGVSTQFVILDGILWNSVDSQLVVADEAAKSGYASSNAYLDKSGGKYVKSVANPWNYSFLFVIAMALGGLLSRMTGGIKETGRDLVAPRIWRDRYGDGATKRYLFAALGGFAVLFGARLAGGCTSGHMMSGMMQTSVSGYLFAMGAFAAAVPTAVAVYGRE